MKVDQALGIIDSRQQGLLDVLDRYSDDVHAHAVSVLTTSRAPGHRASDYYARVAENTFRVRGRGGIYTTKVIWTEDGDVWITCTCPNGDHLGSRPKCWHTALVALVAYDFLTRKRDQILAPGHPTETLKEQ